ncbi:MAG: hypothetical protein WBD67_14085 [Terracidiphilus sp.]
MHSPRPPTCPTKKRPSASRPSKCRQTYRRGEEPQSQEDTLPENRAAGNRLQPRLDHALIREQLVRLPTHPLFANSKRYPALLAYAGEILYNPLYLDSLIAKAPADWQHKNLEAVIETQVIQGHSGPPNALAIETW